MCMVARLGRQIYLCPFLGRLGFANTCAVLFYTHLEVVLIHAGHKNEKMIDNTSNEQHPLELHPTVRPFTQSKRYNVSHQICINLLKKLISTSPGCHANSFNSSPSRKPHLSKPANHQNTNHHNTTYKIPRNPSFLSPRFRTLRSSTTSRTSTSTPTSI